MACCAPSSSQINRPVTSCPTPLTLSLPLQQNCLLIPPANPPPPPQVPTPLTLPPTSSVLVYKLSVCVGSIQCRLHSTVLLLCFPPVILYVTYYSASFVMNCDRSKLQNTCVIVCEHRLVTSTVVSRQRLLAGGFTSKRTLVRRQRKSSNTFFF